MIRRPLLLLAFAVCTAGMAFAASPDAAAQAVAPPVIGSTAERADEAAIGLPVSPERLAQASRDQRLDPFLAFGGVMGPGFARSDLPAVARLLFAVRRAVVTKVAEAKRLFHRDRPYVSEPELARCSRGDLFLADDRSYPSGHAALGMAWALALAEIDSPRADAILARGRDYGLSRVICGVHWPSDVAAGQSLAQAVFAGLAGGGSFDALVDEARAELAAQLGH